MASRVDAITHVVLFQIKTDISALERRAVSDLEYEDHGSIYLSIYGPFQTEEHH